MKLKQLESYLQQVDGFEQPKVSLEQYVTPAHIASHMLYTIDQTYDDLTSKVVADFGCGTAVLSIGSCMLGASHVMSFDVDDDALAIAQNNVESFEVESNIDFLRCDVTVDNKMVDYLAQRKMVDVVVMNPPFGTKNNKGIDMTFLENATKIAQNSVYSLHKTATRDHVMKKADQWNCDVQVVAELHYNIARTYKFHKRDSHDVYVDFIRLQPR